MAAGVVVWEWKNEFGSWRPYDPKISTVIESYNGSSTVIQLGSIDPKMYLYAIDLQNMCQIRQGTGTQRQIRRTVHPSTSPIAKGITWQWEGEGIGHWNDFDTEITEYLEDCFKKKQTVVDLSKSQFHLPYHINLLGMTQKRIETGRVRNIQRVFTSTSYPLDLSSGNGNKRRSGGVNKNVGAKKLKTATSSNPVSASGYGFLPQIINPSVTAAASNPNTNISVSTFTGFSQSGAASIPPSSSVIHFGSSQGPLTRSRFSQYSRYVNQPSQSPTQPPGVIQTIQTVPSTVHSNFPVMNSHVSAAPQTVSGPFSGFGNMGNAPFGFQPNVFQGQTSLPNTNISHGGLVGGNMQIGSWYNYLPTPVSSAGHQPGLFQQGNLNPSHLFPGSRSSKIRPSAPNSSSTLPPLAATSTSTLPKYDRIPNFKSAKQAGKQVSADNILQSYVSALNSPPADEDCCICYEKLIEASGHGSGGPEDRLVLQLEKCSHMFHKLCLSAMYDSGSKDGSLQCPSCKTIYGEKLGNCPKGEMEYRTINSELQGYEGCQTIQILYHIHSGIQGQEHPNPGKRFSTRGFPRIGYLPDCDKGRKVLQLLIVAWKRRITFTIGSSTTTGEENTVTWNEIHHKTELGSNYSGHGYPDPKYLENVLSELAVHGITEKDLP